MSKTLLSLLILGALSGSSFALEGIQDSNVADRNLEDYDYWRGLIEGLASVGSAVPSSEPSSSPVDDTEAPSDPPVVIPSKTIKNIDSIGDT
jgi:hypothetical protein